MSRARLKIIFIGTPDFAVPILEKLIKSDYKPVLVITAPDKSVGRKQIVTPPPAKLVAEKFNIPIFQPQEIKNQISKIKNLKPDLIVVAAYGQILPKKILGIPKYGCLNIHPSLLPKYRGPSPIQYAILNGDEETGVTIILMNEKVDAGPIISTYNLQLTTYNYTYEELEKKLAELGAKLLIETIPKWTKGEIQPQPQDESEATYTKILKKEDGRIDWKKSAEEIERQIKAFNPEPGTYTKIQNSKCKSQNENSKCKIFKIYKATVLPCKIKKRVGEAFLTEDGKLAVACGLVRRLRRPKATSSAEGRSLGEGGKDALLLEEIQPEGKRKMTAQEFLRGHQDIIGKTLN